jgi:hypothetical protein
MQAILLNGSLGIFKRLLDRAKEGSPPHQTEAAFQQPSCLCSDEEVVEFRRNRKTIWSSYLLNRFH